MNNYCSNCMGEFRQGGSWGPRGGPWGQPQGGPSQPKISAPPQEVPTQPVSTPAFFNICNCFNG